MHFYFKIKKNFKNVLHIWHIHAQTYRTVTIYPTFHLHSYLAVKGWVHGFVHQRFLSCVYVHSRGCGSLYFYAIF